MVKIQLYIATSIDGFIARKNGELDWLNNLPNPNNLDYGYNNFLSQIDTVIIGRKTYEEILSFGIDWPYGNCKTYVATTDKNYKTKTENSHTINIINKKTIEEIKTQSKNKIWVVGGGILISEFLNFNAIDEMIICIIPIIIGSGIKLFPNNPLETKFNLIKSEPFETGAINLTYRAI